MEDRITRLEGMVLAMVESLNANVKSLNDNIDGLEEMVKELHTRDQTELRQMWASVYEHDKRINELFTDAATKGDTLSMFIDKMDGHGRRLDVYGRDIDTLNQLLTSLKDRVDEGDFGLAAMMGQGAGMPRMLNTDVTYSPASNQVPDGVNMGGGQSKHKKRRTRRRNSKKRKSKKRKSNKRKSKKRN
jgi:hypothetical protein